MGEDRTERVRSSDRLPLVLPTITIHEGNSVGVFAQQQKKSNSQAGSHNLTHRYLMVHQNISDRTVQTQYLFIALTC